MFSVSQGNKQKNKTVRTVDDMEAIEGSSVYRSSEKQSLYIEE